jgi:prepilin-type N-terminal cleavage/methylation domain-containing protein
MKVKYKSGFSLIELSIVVMIMSTVSVAALTIFGNKDLADKNRETKAKLERVMESAKIFYILNGELPCPAGLATAVNHADFGYGGGTTTAGVCANRTGLAGNIATGGVPIIELGLPPQYAFDAWGNRIVYIIDRRFTALVPGATTWTNTTYSVSEIRIRDNAPTPNFISVRRALASEIGTGGFTDCIGQVIAAASITHIAPPNGIGDCPPLLLLSHGANGLYSYNYNGTPKPSSFGQSPAEQANATVGGLDAVFVYDEMNRDMKDFDYTVYNYFDDILVYRSVPYFKP